ncbi:MAG: hypothetical protein PVG53_06780 [Holophagae bacterium]
MPYITVRCPSRRLAGSRLPRRLLDRRDLVHPDQDAGHELF